MNKLSKRKKESLKLFLLIVPFMILVFIFSYFPLYGWVYSLYDFRPPRSLSDCDFVGLKWFYNLLETPEKRKQIYQVLTNTFVMSGLSIAGSWIPIVFAIMLTEVRNKAVSKVIQTMTTLPNFISWVLVYSLAFSLFSSYGMLNSFLMSINVIQEPILFLQDSQNTWLTMWLWNTWKGLGWSSIIYMAAIAGVDQSLFEAARVDGANKFQLIWNVTVPAILPTYFVLLLLTIANFLNNGFEQYFVFENAFNKNKIQVLDLYVYNLGMGSGSYSLATAIGIMKSIVSISLLFVSNALSKLFRGESIV